MMKTVWLAQLASTLYLTGLIWFVQVVHYPLFARVSVEHFSAYEIAHSNLTTFVVAPPMLIEAVTVALWLLHRPAQVRAVEAWVGAGLVVVIWLSTWFLQVPKHGILSARFDAQAHQFLVLSNWLRTIAWSLRSGLLLWLTARAMTV